MGRRLIVCSDGTWQDLYANHPTNVVKITQAILPSAADGISQIVYYDEGIGTKQIGTENSIIDKLTKLGGGGIGLGIDKKIKNAYIFLCLNYQPGDEIYMFGFSRGAYTVRCLAGLIYNSGLPSRKYIRKIPEAYELYRDRADSKKPSGSDAVSFRKSHGDRVPIKALCCWDTVASIGLPNLIPSLNLDANFNQRYSFYDHKVNPTIENAFHAVAADENRKVYYYTPMEVDQGQPTKLSQVWFPGGHGSVGGGLEIEHGNIDGKPVYGIRPAYNAPLETAASSLGYKIREIPETTRFSDGIDISIKRRWKDKACNYRPQNLERRFGKDLDSWTSPA